MIRDVFLLLLCREFSSNKASINYRCSDGRYPLHVATYNNLFWSHGLDLFVDANPFLLSEMDEISGLKPFALAAASDGVGVEKDIDLSSIFQLLCHDPSALGMRTS